MKLHWKKMEFPMVFGMTGMVRDKFTGLELIMVTMFVAVTMPKRVSFHISLVKVK